jgi:hypothetical protein
MYVELLNGFEVKQLFDYGGKKYSYKFVQFLFVTKYTSFHTTEFQKYIQSAVGDILSKLPSKDGIISRSSLIVTDIPPDVLNQQSAIVSDTIMKTFSVNSSGREVSIDYLKALIAKGSYTFLSSGSFPTKDSILNLVDKVGFHVINPRPFTTSTIQRRNAEVALLKGNFKDKDNYEKVVFVLGDEKKSTAFLSYIKEKAGTLPSFYDNQNNVYYAFSISKELILYELDKQRTGSNGYYRGKYNIQILFVYEKFYDDTFELCMKDFKDFLDTLSPLDRVLLTQHISIVNIDPPSRTLSRYKFSIGAFELHYEEGQRYYSIYKPTQGGSSIQTPADVRSKLSQDACFVQLNINPADLNLDIVTNQV